MKRTEPQWEIMLPQSMRSRWTDLLHFGVDAKGVANRSGGRLVYVATPYSRVVVDDHGKWCRMRDAEASVWASKVCADLARAGATGVSPIVLSTGMCGASRLDPLDEKFWNAWCAPLLAACGSIYVPDLPGWQASRGIWTECVWALGHNMPVLLEAR
ncbi:DUF1937 family protein [Sedimentimonas flavescens]|uniref:DUF1937 family protein n=1 Tax=Sedimentimonas flavescens TaxID=2851012 RepID=A0ABT2ZV14_9RHOB|nr:DUF1937 family protein [Sedimentimonas flavescens]MCV2877591.1 DUF1937 family protein [Sedimentimonas flavescens]